MASKIMLVSFAIRIPLDKMRQKSLINKKINEKKKTNKKTNNKIGNSTWHHFFLFPKERE